MDAELNFAEWAFGLDNGGDCELGFGSHYPLMMTCQSHLEFISGSPPAAASVAITEAESGLLD